MGSMHWVGVSKRFNVPSWEVRQLWETMEGYETGCRSETYPMAESTSSERNYRFYVLQKTNDNFTNRWSDLGTEGAIWMELIEGLNRSKVKMEKLYLHSFYLELCFGLHLFRRRRILSEFIFAIFREFYCRVSSL
jgi:hypothetical protein